MKKVEGHFYAIPKDRLFEIDYRQKKSIPVCNVLLSSGQH